MALERIVKAAKIGVAAAIALAAYTVVDAAHTHPMDYTQSTSVIEGKPFNIKKGKLNYVRTAQGAQEVTMDNGSQIRDVDGDGITDQLLVRYHTLSYKSSFPFIKLDNIKLVNRNTGFGNYSEKFAEADGILYTLRKESLQKQ
jgi:hypothetical protein